jgi:hypothetical protein
LWDSDKVRLSATPTFVYAQAVSGSTDCKYCHNEVLALKCI